MGSEEQPTVKPTVPPTLSKYFQSIGSKGGKAARGPAKSRGNSAHYQKLSRLGAAARAAKAKLKT